MKNFLVILLLSLASSVTIAIGGVVENNVDATIKSFNLRTGFCTKRNFSLPDKGSAFPCRVLVGSVDKKETLTIQNVLTYVSAVNVPLELTDAEKLIKLPGVIVRRWFEGKINQEVRVEDNQLNVKTLTVFPDGNSWLEITNFLPGK